MAELGSSNRGGKVASDVYTVLMAIAMLALAATVGYVWYRHTQLFDAHPFTVETIHNAVAFASTAIV